MIFRQSLRGTAATLCAIVSAHTFAAPVRVDRDPPGISPSSSPEPPSETHVSAAAHGPGPVVAEVPEAETDEAPDLTADLELAMRAFNTWALHPSPSFRGANGLHDDAVVTYLKRDGTPLRAHGETVKRVLAIIFNPDAATYRFAAPEVRIEGRYGMVTRRFSVQELSGEPECLVQHAEAFRTTRGWRFLSITVAMMPVLHACIVEADSVHGLRPSGRPTAGSTGIP